MKNKNNGYVLVLTLMILSLLVVLVTSMFYNQTSHQALTKTLIDREKAKMLALSGISIAMAKLYIKPEKKKDEQKDKKQSQPDQKDSDKQQKALLTRLLPILNRFVTVNLTENKDQIDGTIKYYISSEEGKIDLNNFFDFSTKKFIGGKTAMELDASKYLQQISKRIEELTGQKNVFASLQKYLQSRQYPLNDVTELLNIKEFEYFKDKVFLKANNQNKNLYLTDIFTNYSKLGKLQPWMLSQSIMNIYDLKRQTGSTTGDKVTQEILKNFKTKTEWKTNWNKVLQPFYGKDFASLIKGSEFVFDSEFKPKVFSVISYGTFNKVTVALYAILQIEDDQQIKLKKLYWI